MKSIYSQINGKEEETECMECAMPLHDGDKVISDSWEHNIITCSHGCFYQFTHKEATKMNHTPTPWTVKSHGEHVIICGEKGSIGFNDMGLGCFLVNDAEYIVRCVNSHEALVNAIHFAIGYIHNDEVNKLLRDALAQAEKP